MSVNASAAGPEHHSAIYAISLREHVIQNVRRARSGPDVVMGAPVGPEVAAVWMGTGEKCVKRRFWSARVVHVGMEQRALRISIVMNAFVLMVSGFELFLE